ncbi:hypothetical protein FVE85_2347 [Porphyridium purpureum]|uniref:Protein YeeZ n=1 Tax=Porphyridium purpureum TaxID=35688 RepID=A0A5J4YZC6_PORPP|nr:hypothetical protein FVE85_2347 [Porphyridium purpureum]|eukprot:POR5478..scf209_3
MAAETSRWAATAFAVFPCAGQARRDVRATRGLVSSRAMRVQMGAAGSRDLLVVGAGELGKRVGRLWKQHEETSSARVVAVTKSNASHAELRSYGLEAYTWEQYMAERDAADPGLAFPYVLLSASFGAIAQDPALVASALSQWDAASDGVFVYTSSTGVVATGAKILEPGVVLDENAPLSEEPRAQKLAHIEHQVLQNAGCVARLAGLYTRTRGPHNFWVRAGKVDSSADCMINMVHYQDAARYVTATLRKGEEARNKLLLVTSEALSRREICEAAIEKVPDLQPPAGAEMQYGPPAEAWESRRVFSNDWTRQFLDGIEPLFPTYRDGLAWTE